MFFTRHGIAEDHGRAIEVQRPLGIAVVFQRFAGAGDRPFLCDSSIASTTRGGIGKCHLIGSHTYSRTQPPILE